MQLRYPPAAGITFSARVTPGLRSRADRAAIRQTVSLLQPDLLPVVTVAQTSEPAAISVHVSVPSALPSTPRPAPCRACSRQRHVCGTCPYETPTEAAVAGMRHPRHRQPRTRSPRVAVTWRWRHLLPSGAVIVRRPLWRRWRSLPCARRTRQTRQRMLRRSLRHQRRARGSCRRWPTSRPTQTHRTQSGRWPAPSRLCCVALPATEKKSKSGCRDRQHQHRRGSRAVQFFKGRLFGKIRAKQISVGVSDPTKASMEPVS